jgi:hypothetical protein
VLDVSHQLDLSALSCERPTGLDTTRCVRAARHGEDVMAIGFPYYARRGANIPHFVEGRVLRYEGKDCHFFSGNYVHSGFSGGGLVTKGGDFCGVVCGYGTGYNYAPSGPALLNFAKRFCEVQE